MSVSPARGAMQPPLRLRLFVRAVAVAAAATALASSRAAAEPERVQILVAIVVTGMVGAAHTFPVQLAPHARVSADTAPAFAAVLLLPPPLAIAVSVAGIAAGEALRRTAVIQMTYNVSVAALRTAAAVAVFALLAPASLTRGDGGWRMAVGSSLAAAAMYLVNAGLIDAVIAVQRKLNPLQGWWTRRRGQFTQEASLYLLGVLVAAVGARWPAALLLLAVPSTVVYRSLRDGAAVRIQTRQAVEEMADVVDRRDPYMVGHSRHVADLAQALALRLGLPANEAERVAAAARVHNIGNAGIRISLLAKSGGLTVEEWSEIRTHPEVSAGLLARFPDYAPMRDLVLSHHERWDGRGYPRGLGGERIPLGARVIAVADAITAMASPRPYRPALAPMLVRSELIAGRGTQFDPRVVDAALDLIQARPDVVTSPAAPLPGVTGHDRR